MHRQTLMWFATCAAAVAALSASAVEFSKAGYWEAEGSPRRIETLTTGWEFSLDGFKTSKRVAQRIVRRFFSPKCHLAPSAEDATMKVVVSLDEFKVWYLLTPKDRGALHVAIRPREIFGGLGRALEAEVQS